MLYSLRDADELSIVGLLEGSKTKERKFTETVELQVGLKNYDPQKDKRFSGTVKLPYMPRPQMKVAPYRWHYQRVGGIRVLSVEPVT